MADIEPPRSKRDLDLRFLGLAFGADAANFIEVEEPGPEVFSRLGKGAATVTLRDLAETHEPIVRPRVGDSLERPGADTRFEVIGEIARGGMGVVYKARDKAIGRDVALKTLAKSSSAELRYRFIEEAQVCGQLHHPGIVPIHDIGLLDDGRPFFVMKLVSGRTWAAILKARANPGENRSECLAVYDRVCQAVAYAHARGVIHRDLKPSNILVGGFGETQVMDWGLAKVMKHGGLADEPGAVAHDIETVRSGSSVHDSMGGSVFGTAPYMAPEQARGEVNTLDERTDVFSLGAILLEILTGSPPYQAAEREAVIALAAEARLEPALARLENSGADVELLQLTRACLAPAPSHRPADAGVVARRVREYLSAVEARAHRAELAAVEARTEARGERRARRLTVLLAIVMMTVALVGAVGWLAIEDNRRERVASLSRSVSDATARGRRMQAEALAAPLEDLAKWTYALAIARDAEAMTTAPEAPPELAANAAALVAELTAQRDQRRAAHRVATKLDEIRVRHENRHDSPETDDAYATVFMEYGIDPKVQTAAEISETVRASLVADALVSALDDWAITRRNVRGEHTDGWRLITDAAARSETDPLRARLRSAWADDDLPGLRALATPGVLEETTVATTTFLAQSLFDAGAKDLALTVLRSAQLRHPHDYMVNHDLGHWQNVLGDVPEAEVIKCFSMALATRPASAHARVDLAKALHREGDLRGAIAHYEVARTIDLEDSYVLHKLATLYALTGETALELERVESLVEAHPNHATGHLLRASILWRKRGRLAEALDSFDRAIQLEPGHAPALCNRGLLLLDMGRNSEALTSLRTGHTLGVARAADWSSPSADWVRQAERALSLEPVLERVLAGGPRPASTNDLHDLGALAFAKGHLLTSAGLLRAAVELSGADGDTCRYCAVRAAVGVGVGDGALGLTEAERRSWRNEARAMFEDEIASARSRLATGALTRKAIPGLLSRWRDDWALSPVRADSGFAGLQGVDPTERQAWVRVWGSFDALFEGDDG